MAEVILNGQKIEVGAEEEFHINDEDLDSEITQAAMLIVKYGELFARCKMAATTAKTRAELQLDTKMIEGRENAEQTGKRATEAALKEKARQDPTWQQAYALQIQAEYAASAVEACYKSAQSRSNLVNTLCRKQTAEISRNAF
jgi:hypothetical protein